MCFLHYKEISPHQRRVLGDGKLVIGTWKTQKTNQTTPLINSRKSKHCARKKCKNIQQIL